MCELVIPQHAIQTEAPIDIGAPPERGAGIYASWTNETKSFQEPSRARKSTKWGTTGQRSR